MQLLIMEELQPATLDYGLDPSRWDFQIAISTRVYSTHNVCSHRNLAATVNHFFRGTCLTMKTNEHNCEHRTVAEFDIGLMWLYFCEKEWLTINIYV